MDTNPTRQHVATLLGTNDDTKMLAFAHFQTAKAMHEDGDGRACLLELLTGQLKPVTLAQWLESVAEYADGDTDEIDDYLGEALDEWS